HRHAGGHRRSGHVPGFGPRVVHHGPLHHGRRRGHPGRLSLTPDHLDKRYFLSLLSCAGSPWQGSVPLTAGRVAPMPAKLFVGNLSFQATEEDLRELFQQAGTVETVRIITDQFTGRPRGFGFVEMGTKEEATKAVEMLNGRLFRDRNL